MKKNIIYISMLSVSLALSSCTKFLDIKPYDKTIPETAEDFSAIIHELCDEIDGSSTTTVGVKSVVDGDDPDTQECWMDNLETNLTTYPTGNYLSYYVGTNCGKGTEYKHCYATISRCNIVMSEMEEDRDTQEGKDILGTAYALRGIAYYQLLRLFCPPVGSDDEQLGVPIVTEFDMEARPVRSTIQETISQAESDMLKAIDYNIQNELYRFNNDVIKGFLARLYFWSGQYEKAKETALDVLERHPLLGRDDYKEMMSAANGLNGNMLLRADLYQTYYSLTSSYLQARPMSSRFLKLFAEKDDDIRYTLFVGSKRKNKKRFFTGLRSAELYLIAMESCYHLGDTDGALQMLNTFRQHRINNYTPYTMSTLPAVDTSEYIQQDAQGKPLTPLIQAILNERRKELYLENDRFYEMKRNGRPEFWVMKNGLKYYTRKFMYTFALPASDVQLNSGLVQNPGYTEYEY